MLEHVLASIFPGEHDSWQPGKLARADYDRTKAIMIGEGQIDDGPLLRAVRRTRGAGCSVT